MNTRRLIPILTLSVLLMTGGMAQAQNISPVNPDTGQPITGSAVYVTLSVSDWLPSPNSTVNITVNGAGDIASIKLVCPDGSTTFTACLQDVPYPGYNPVALPLPPLSPKVRTSAYPGVCTNFPSDAYLNPSVPVDFTLSGNALTSFDCGGMAVILVTTTTNAQYTFVIPQDTNFNGIPDLWEATFGGSLVANDDPDHDGLSSFDEYRGVMLSDTSTSLLHTRLHPTQADLFVSFVNPGCGATESLLDGTLLTTPPTYIPDPNDGRSIFANLNSLRPATALGPRVHPVGYPAGPPATHGTITTGEVVDKYQSCHYDAATSQLVFDPPLGDLDRLIAANAVYPVSESPQTTLTVSVLNGIGTFTASTPVFNSTHVGSVLSVSSGGNVIATAGPMGFPNPTTPNPTILTGTVISGLFPASNPAGSWRLSDAGQNTLRCVESTDTSSTTVFATGGWGTANQAVSCTVYTKRIENRLNNPTTGLIAQGGSRKIRVQKFDGSNWVPLFTEGDAGVLTRGEAIRRLVAEVIRYYATMEFTHMGKVRATLQAGACAPHDCAGSGSLVDKDFVQIIDKNSSTGFNNFRIPTQANTTIQDEFKHRIQ